MKLPQSILKDYPRMTACIRYREENGNLRDWYLMGHPKNDNSKTLRAHLKRIYPTAKFIGWALK